MPPRKGKSSDDSDDDDDELRAIRAARGLKVSEGPPDEDEDAFMPSKSKPNVFAVKGPAHNPVQELVEEVMDDVEAAAMDESRMNFPMSFGQTAMTRKKTGKELQAVHASNKRSSASTGGGGREDLQAMVLEAHAAAVAVQKDEPEPGPALGGAPDGAIGAGVVDQEEEDEDEESDDEDTDDSGLGGLVPCSHEAILKGHSKNVNTMALDPSGSRLLTGGADASVRFWDFNGMDASLRSFRDITPWEGQQVMSLQYSNSGDRFLCATTKNQCNLYTRDGVKEVEFMKGDMYVHDMAQTKGHVAALVTAKWHPTSRNTCMTASIDG